MRPGPGVTVPKPRPVTPREAFERWGDPRSWGPRDPRRAAFYSSRNWTEAARYCKYRANWTCTQCGGTYLLEADHIIRPEDGGELLESDNLRCLCKFCHQRKTSAAISKREKGKNHDPNSCSKCGKGLSYNGEWHYKGP